MNEFELLARVRAAQWGDRTAFGELMLEFEPEITAVVQRRLRNHADTAEVVQDVFLQAMRKLPQLREVERFAGWLRQIARRMAINRAVRRPPGSRAVSDPLAHLASRPSCPQYGMLRAEATDELRRGLSQLRELDRRTLIRFYLDGRSLKQLSVEFACPIGTIKRRLHTARSRLKECMSGAVAAG